MKIKRNKGFFSISAVAKMFSVHQQTIRLYEKQGLISPERSSGNTRLFSEDDINRLEEVIYLTHELGINLAGVEMILKLKKQMAKMQKDMNTLFDSTQKELDKNAESAKLVVQSSSQRLMKIKQNQPIKTTTENEHTPIKPVPNESIHTADDNNSNSSLDDGSIDAHWEIEYED